MSASISPVKYESARLLVPFLDKLVELGRKCVEEDGVFRKRLVCFWFEAGDELIEPTLVFSKSGKHPGAVVPTAECCRGRSSCPFQYAPVKRHSQTTPANAMRHSTRGLSVGSWSISAWVSVWRKRPGLMCLMRLPVAIATTAWPLIAVVVTSLEILFTEPAIDR
jgi:hypothetical protein